MVLSVRNLYPVKLLRFDGIWFTCLEMIFIFIFVGWLLVHFLVPYLMCQSTTIDANILYFMAFFYRLKFYFGIWPADHDSDFLAN